MAANNKFDWQKLFSDILIASAPVIIANLSSQPKSNGKGSGKRKK